jgi:hypothetical protein
MDGLAETRPLRQLRLTDLLTLISRLDSLRDYSLAGLYQAIATPKGGKGGNPMPG